MGRAEQSCSHHGGQEAEKGGQKGTRDKIPLKTATSALLPPAKPHLLKFPESPKIAPSARDLGFQMRVWETFQSQAVTFYLWSSKAYDHHILQNSPRISSLNNSSIVQSLTPKSLLTLILGAVIPCKIKKKVTSFQDAMAQNKHFHSKWQE
jgi:hypothetical protein